MASPAPVQVAVRARPLSERERRLHPNVTIEMSPRSVRLFDPKGRHTAGGVGPMVQDNKEFSYDFCYWSVAEDAVNFASQERVYSDIGPALLAGAFSGYNACVLAYGQTGSGKTYTMMGTRDDPGVIPRLCKALFEEIDEHQGPGVSYRTSVSFSEIYNEHIGDLLQASSQKKVQHNLKVREHPTNGPYVPDLSAHTVVNSDQMLKLLSQGNSARATGSTQMNDSSSRSHAVFTISFKKACFSGDNPSETSSHISLVDLAGSERSKDTGATGSRLKEGNQINKSLVALGNVISALADQSKGKSRRKTICHVPYRDSVLTWLLKDSLGGNSLTVMVAAISPSQQNFQETLSTLRYASRAKDIVNRPVVNEDSNVKLIRELRSEVTRLKSVLNAMQIDIAGGASSNALDEQLKNLEKNETLANHLTKEWAGQWDEFRKTNHEEVAIKDQGVGVALDSGVPHLVTIDSDITSTGIRLYYIKEGVTRLASHPSSDQDVELCFDEDENLECEITSSSNNVTIHPMQGQCTINGVPVSEPTRLEQGQIILIGCQNIFRFNHPAEAAQLKQKQRTSTTTLRRRSSMDLAALLSPRKKPATPVKRGQVADPGSIVRTPRCFSPINDDDDSALVGTDSADVHSSPTSHRPEQRPTNANQYTPGLSIPFFEERERSLSELSFERAELDAELEAVAASGEATKLAELLLSTSLKQDGFLSELENSLSDGSPSVGSKSPSLSCSSAGGHCVASLGYGGSAEGSVQSVQSICGNPGVGVIAPSSGLPSAGDPFDDVRTSASSGIATDTDATPCTSFALDEQCKRHDAARPGERQSPDGSSAIVSDTAYHSETSHTKVSGTEEALCNSQRLITASPENNALTTAQERLTQPNSGETSSLTNDVIGEAVGDAGSSGSPTIMEALGNDTAYHAETSDTNVSGTDAALCNSQLPPNAAPENASLTTIQENSTQPTSEETTSLTKDAVDEAVCDAASSGSLTIGRKFSNTSSEVCFGGSSGEYSPEIDEQDAFEKENKGPSPGVSDSTHLGMDSEWHAQRDRLFSLVQASEEAHRHLSEEVEAAQKNLVSTETEPATLSMFADEDSLCPDSSNIGDGYSSRSFHSCDLAFVESEDEVASSADQSMHLFDFIRDARVKHVQDVSGWVSCLNGASPSSEQLKKLILLQLHQQEELREILGGRTDVELQASHDGTWSALQESMQQQSGHLAAILSQLQTQQEEERHSQDKPAGQQQQGEEPSEQQRQEQQPREHHVSEQQPREHHVSEQHSQEQPLEHQEHHHHHHHHGGCEIKSRDEVISNDTGLPDDSISNVGTVLSVEQSLAVLPSCVSIPSVTLRDNGRTSPYHVFCIEVSIGSFFWSVERRYREFLAQHLQLVQDRHELSCLRMPPTKWFGNKKLEFVEQRRKRLEMYLQMLLLQLIRMKHFKWHHLESLEDLVIQFRKDLPLLDENSIIPAGTSATTADVAKAKGKA